MIRLSIPAAAWIVVLDAGRRVDTTTSILDRVRHEWVDCKGLVSVPWAMMGP